MQNACDAMDALDVPVLDGLGELRCAVAALGDAAPGPAAPPGLAPGLSFPSAKSLGPQRLGEAGEIRWLG